MASHVSTSADYNLDPNPAPSGFRQKYCKLRHSVIKPPSLQGVLLILRNHHQQTWIISDLHSLGSHWKRLLLNVDSSMITLFCKSQMLLNWTHSSTTHTYTNTHTYTHQSWYNRVNVMYKMTSFLCISGPDCIRKNELTQSEMPPISRKVLLQVTEKPPCPLSFRCSHRRSLRL